MGGSAIGRRGALGLSASLAATPLAAFGQLSPAPETTDVVVIGAGLSGLTAARRLSEAGPAGHSARSARPRWRAHLSRPDRPAALRPRRTVRRPNAGQGARTRRRIRAADQARLRRGQAHLGIAGRPAGIRPGHAAAAFCHADGPAACHGPYRCRGRSCRGAGAMGGARCRGIGRADAGQLDSRARLHRHDTGFDHLLHARGLRRGARRNIHAVHGLLHRAGRQPGDADKHAGRRAGQHHCRWHAAALAQIGGEAGRARSPQSRRDSAWRRMGRV